MPSLAMHSNSSATKESISFCSNSFPKPQNDHELVLLVTAEIKKLHTEVEKLKTKLDAVHLEKDTCKQEFIDLIERLINEKNVTQHHENYSQTVISCSEASSPKAATPTSSQSTPAPVVAPVHDVHSSKPPIGSVAEVKRLERERQDFIEKCERKDGLGGQSFFIRVDEIARFKQEFATREAEGTHKWKSDC